MAEVPQHADSLDDPGNLKRQRRHWIGAVPMEAELVRGRRVVPGLATLPQGEAALALRESDCYSGDFGLFHTGIPGCDGASDGPGEQKVFTLNSAIMAVGEGNYGRLGRISRAATRPATVFCSCRSRTSNRARCPRSRRRPTTCARSTSHSSTAR